MMEFQWLRAIIEGLVTGLLFWIVSSKCPQKRIAFTGIWLLVEIASTLSIYIGQEDSSYFFLHPYFVFLIACFMDFPYVLKVRKTVKRAIFEKIVLMPVFVIPIMSGAVETIAWLIKLYHKNILGF
ncbi:MAG: hypothetical protein K6F39_05475 [Lachnospiraceae bacterium]|nr:hypothetical protein [Lachnospiraceae bacterium]